MAAKNFGTGVSRILDPSSRAWAHVILNQGRPALEYEINLMQDIALDRAASVNRTLLPSGFLSLPDFVTVDDASHPNAIYIPSQSGDELVANVNGWGVRVRGTAAEDLDGGVLNNVANLVTLPAAPDTGSRTDLVYLEVWLGLVSGNSNGQPLKPPAQSRIDDLGNVIQKSQVWPFGNILYGGGTLDDDIVDPDVALETSKRVQLQYAIRVWEGIDLPIWPRGFGAADIVGIGPQEPFASVSGTPFVADPTDGGLWVSELPDLTVDGKVYAVPVFAVHRRNSAGFDEISNPNGSSPASDAEGLLLRHDGFASDRIVPSDVVDLRHKILLSPQGAEPTLRRTTSAVFAGELATSFGSDPVHTDVAGSSVSVQKKLVTKSDFNALRSDHVGFADGIKRVFSADASVEKSVFMAISQPPGLSGEPLPWEQVAGSNTITLTLPAESTAVFSAREPRGILSVTQEAIVFNSVEVSVSGKTLTLTFGVGPYTVDGIGTGRDIPQDVWLFIDIEVPPSSGLRAEPLNMQDIIAKSVTTTGLDPSGHRVASASPDPDNNNTFYGSLYQSVSNRMLSAARSLSAPLRDGAIDAFFGGMFDLDLYLDGADAKAVPDSAITTEALSARIDSVFDLDNDLINLDAGWVSGRRAMFVRPLNATASTQVGGFVTFNMSTHALYVINDAVKPDGVALFTLLSPLPLVHLRGAYIRVPGTTGQRSVSTADYTNSPLGDPVDGGVGEIAGSIVPDEQCVAASIVARGDGVDTYRLSQSPVMQVLKVTRTDPGTGGVVSVYEAGLLKEGTSQDMIVPIYIREGSVTDQVAFLTRTVTTAGAEFAPFEFSRDPSSADFVENFRVTYRRLSDITATPGETDLLIGTSDYVEQKKALDPDPVSPGKDEFINKGVTNGHEIFFDADIRVPLPIDAEIDAPLTHVPVQVATLESNTVRVTGISRDMLLTTSSPTALGNAVLPGFAGGATANAFVVAPPAGGDFSGGAIGLNAGSTQTGSAIVSLPVATSGAYDGMDSLSGQKVSLRPSTTPGVFDAILDSDGNQIRAVAEGVPVSAEGDVAAYLSLTAVTEAGEVILLLLSQRNLADRDAASPTFGRFEGAPTVDTAAAEFAVTAYRPEGRPLVRAGGADAHSA